jgi:predicted dehydrogenase
MRRRTFLGSSAAAALAASLTAAPSRIVRAATARPRIRVGQIGTAHAHAAGKMETLRKFADDWEVVGIVEPDEQRRGRLASDPVYRDLPVLSEERLLNTAGLQAVAVETEIAELVPTAARCVAAGLHVHVDKPAGESLAAFHALWDAAERAGRTVQMGYMFRYNPAFQFCFRAVREGWLGEVFELHGVMSKKIADGDRARFAAYPGGAMFELGCHLLDAAVATLGPPQNVIGYARRTKPDYDDLADNQLAVLEYPQATATIRSAFVEPHGGERRQFTVCGTEGVIDIRPLEPPKLLLALEGPLEAHDDGQTRSFQAGYQEVELPPPAGRYDGDFLDLAAIVRGEKAADYGAAHDLAVHEAVLRASGLTVE